MSTDEASSSRSGEPAQELNPYAPSEVPQGHDSPSGSQDEASRQFQVRMAWADRQRFLKAVGPLRLAALAGMLAGVWALWGLLQSWVEFYRAASLVDTRDWILLVRFLFVAAKGVLAMYVCFLNWKLADALAKTAGGRTANMREWSNLQLQLARMMLATIALAVVSFGWESIFFQYLLQTLAPPEL
jgi:hypothetical protein